MSGYSDVVLLDFVNPAGTPSSLISRTFDPFNFLQVDINITGYSAGSVARLQFNGDSGTTAYAYGVFEVASGVTAPTTGVSGAAAGWNVAVTAQEARPLITFRISNISGQVHGGWWLGTTHSVSAATAPVIVQGSGIWTTTSQIIRVTLDVGSGGGTFNSGTQMWVWGHRS